MNIITIYGTVQKDSVEIKTDKDGYKYVVFVAIVETERSKMNNKRYLYRCITYHPIARQLKGNDKVVLNGNFALRVEIKEDKPILNFEIHVHQLDCID